MGQVEKGFDCMAEINEEANGDWFQLEHRNDQHGPRVVEEDNKGECSIIMLCTFVDLQFRKNFLFRTFSHVLGNSWCWQV